MNRFDHLRDPLGPPRTAALDRVLTRARKRRVIRHTTVGAIAAVVVVTLAVSAGAVIRKPDSVSVTPSTRPPAPHVPTTTTQLPPTTTAPTSTTTPKTTSTSPAPTSTTVPVTTWSARQLTITAHSLGAVQVGMTLAQAQAAAGYTFDGSGDGAFYSTHVPTGYPHIYVNVDPGANFVPGSNVACVGVELGTADPHVQTIVTPEGVRLGDSVQHLLAVYGSQARFVPNPGSGIAPAAGYVVTQGNEALVFVVYNNRVVAIMGGSARLTPSDCSG